MKHIALIALASLLGGCAYVEPVIPLIRYEVRRQIVRKAIDGLNERLIQIDEEEAAEGGDAYEE